MMLSPNVKSSKREAVVVFSGGTDSTCVAALLAERFDRLHLLTYEELGTRASARPSQNIERLRERFGAERITSMLFPVDRLLERISYDRYPWYLARHGLFMLSGCGFSSLSWHVRTITYCLERGIKDVADGLTRELIHFPGHMEAVIGEFRRMYAAFGITYTNPVRDWEVPEDQRFIHRLVVNPHGFVSPEGEAAKAPRRTTGQYLYDQGLMPHANVKGSALDRSMQHDCYPFALFNVFAFWYCLSRWHYEEYERRMAALFRHKVDDMIALLKEYEALGSGARLARQLEPAQSEKTSAANAESMPAMVRNE